MNPRKIYSDIVKMLSSVTSHPEAEARWFIEEVFGMPKEIFFITEEIDTVKLKRLHLLVKRRIKERIPIQYIFQKAYFMGLELFVNPWVLIPRPETEILVSYVIKIYSHRETPSFFVDVGTGSGAIAISISYFMKIPGIATDASRRALTVAKTNIEKYKVSVELLCANLLDPFKEASLDLIVSNPPYIGSNELTTLHEEVQKEPASSLIGGEDGHEITVKLMEQAFIRLKKGGSLIIETHRGILEKVIARAKDLGFRVRAVIKDYSGYERAIHLEK
ncbi:MAG: peptide chain release factor N(5)-glutamine methyltransferase [Candidatus Hydrothermae bacterium]|nr:peptide chain release factor N(5)-glutamine methyltransferase [Candidatus Hydrothermae bacterium]